MDNTVIIVVCTMLTAFFTALPSIKNGKQKKDIAEIKQILVMRKEENSITLDAAEAAIDAAISLGKNGPCKDAKKRIVDYRNKCLEHRL
jgi:hypothetical protein